MEFSRTMYIQLCRRELNFVDWNLLQLLIHSLKFHGWKNLVEGAIYLDVKQLIMKNKFIEENYEKNDR